jgi:hypothetical protein
MKAKLKAKQMLQQIVGKKILSAFTAKSSNFSSLRNQSQLKNEQNISPDVS